MFWSKKKKIENKKVDADYNALNDDFKVEPLAEPKTLAVLRLEGGAKDVGSDSAIKMYNSQKTKLSNQWVNPFQSVNTGFGAAHQSYYLYQTINYYECYTLAQDGLFANIFRVLSETPFSKGGELVGDYSTEEKDKFENYARKYNLWNVLKAAVKSSFVLGGCLIYLDFGLPDADLEKPLDLKNIDIRKFRGFTKIDPINVAAIDVNVGEPARKDYMKPKKWYVIGLGTVDSSHFLHFEQNSTENFLKPICMYFGFPLTLLIKSDVANATLASQGLANIINRTRQTYLKTDVENYLNGSNFRARLEWMSKVQDNYSVTPIKMEETVEQFSMSLSGYSESVELFYQLISAKTAIPQSILLGKGTVGLSGTQEGDRRNWYDECHRIQDSTKRNLLIMYGICAGQEDGKFVVFNDFEFFPLEEVSEREVAENLRTSVESAKALVELGARPDGVLKWLKSYKKFSLDEIEGDFLVDTEEYEDVVDTEAIGDVNQGG